MNPIDMVFTQREGLVMKERYLWISIIVIAISWGINYVYFHSKQLAEPIFLTHYYEKELYDESQLTFYYLANKGDSSEVAHIRFVGENSALQNNEFIWAQNNPQYHQELRHHYVSSFTITLRKEQIPMEPNTSEITFEKMEVVFNNGPTLMVDIGKIQFISVVRAEGILEAKISGGGGDRSEQTLVALQPLSIEDITFPFQEVENQLEVKVNVDQDDLVILNRIIEGKDLPNSFHDRMMEEWENVKGIPLHEDIFPLNLKNKEWIQVMMYTDLNRKAAFDFSLKLEGRTADGKAFTSPAHIIDPPYLSQKDVDEIIAEKEGEK
jgi:hypothetical protein